MRQSTCGFLLACLLATPLLAQPEGLRTHEGLALTPAGDRVATVEKVETFDPLALEAHSQVVVRSARDGAVFNILDPNPKARYGSLAWSPDGLTLALLATDPKAGTSSLLVARGSEIQSRWTLKGILSDCRWSPDGTSIAVLVVVDAHKPVGATEAGALQVGEIDAAEVQDEQRLAVIGLAAGEPRFVSPPDHWIYEFDWTPDGRGFVATAAPGNGDNNWWVARLVHVDGQSGQLRVLAAPKTQLNFPRVSQNGKTVAFVGGLMSDFGSVGGDVYTVPIEGGGINDVTPGFPGTFTSLAWRGGKILATALQGDRTAIVELRPSGPHVISAESRSLAAGDSRVAFSRDGSLGATVSASFEHASEIRCGPLANLQPVTHDNEGLEPNLTARSITWKSGGFDVQGWLLVPRQLEGHAKHPMVTVVHGGPAAAFTPLFVSHLEPRATPLYELLQKGYFVFLPNPRGSYGQGEAFTAANRRDFGGGDLQDILAGIDAVEKLYPVDEARLGLLGHSYGGFMTMWAVTQTHRFKAAVAGAGISNWISYYGQNGIDEWMLPYFGASAYDEPGLYQKLSPMTYIKNVRTPTFVYVGERDVECPAPQSLEFWRALHTLGVPTSLVIYAGQGHGIRSPRAQQDLRQRELAWFTRYL